MIKRIINITLFLLFITLLVVGFLIKNNLNNNLTGFIKDQATPEIHNLGVALNDSLYNYTKNELKFDLTFIEFGASGCSACKRMEKVMKEIKLNFPDVNVVFLNIRIPKNQNLLLFYGVATIPTQILLNKEGKEFYRHSGYISTKDLGNIINKKITSI